MITLPADQITNFQGPLTFNGPQRANAIQVSDLLAQVAWETTSIR